MSGTMPYAASTVFDRSGDFRAWWRAAPLVDLAATAGRQSGVAAVSLRPQFEAASSIKPASPAVALADAVLKGIAEPLDRMLQRTDERLFDLACRNGNRKGGPRYFDALRQLRIERRALLERFHANVLAAWEMQAGLRAAGAYQTGAPDGIALDLISEIELEQRLAVDGVVARSTVSLGGTLAKLQAALSAIMGRGLDAVDCAIGPRGLCEALLDALRPLEFSMAARLVMLESMESEVISALAKVYPLLSSRIPAKAAAPSRVSTERTSAARPQTGVSTQREPGRIVDGEATPPDHRRQLAEQRTREAEAGRLRLKAAEDEVAELVAAYPQLIRLSAPLDDLALVRWPRYLVFLRLRNEQGSAAWRVAVDLLADLAAAVDGCPGGPLDIAALASGLLATGGHPGEVDECEAAFAALRSAPPAPKASSDLLARAGAAAPAPTHGKRTQPRFSQESARRPGSVQAAARVSDEPAAVPSAESRHLTTALRPAMPARVALDTLQVGQNFLLSRTDAEPLRIRIAWITWERDRFLFVDEAGRKHAEYRVAALAAKLGSGELRPTA